jgi:hypothetical protein
MRRRGSFTSSPARKAGLPTVPAVFIDGANYAEIALVENPLRQAIRALKNKKKPT